MKARYLKFYEKHSGRAALWFKLDSLFSRSLTRRDGLANRRTDYAMLQGNQKLLELHLKLNNVLLEQTTNWNSHDYGGGYFYQGLDDISVTGMRDTTGRLNALDMLEVVKDRTVLDIGSNSGFVSIGLARSARDVVGVESNPYLNKLGRLAAEYLNLKNVTLHDSSFENFKTSSSFDVVTSFANHSTFDGNTQHTIEEYFSKCHSLLNDGGTLLFESHAPSYEGSQLDEVIKIIEQRFDIKQRTTLETGRWFDDGRTLISAIAQ
jgi:cyclopropane fatty-acyl-phospholipid synthase-like methyltransferase